MTGADAARRLEGVIPALAVPLAGDGRIDSALLERQVAWLAAGGVCGLFVGGTTGEGAYFSSAEKRALFDAVRAAAPPEVALCAACIQPSTAQVLEEMEAFRSRPPDYIVAVAPYYMAVPQEAILEHFRRIAAEAPAPLILYNIPQNTHNPMSLETVLALAAEPNVAGLKDSSGDFIGFCRGVLKPLPGPFTWIQGEDLLEAPSYLIGARGAVTGLGNVHIRPYVQMQRAARAGDTAGVLAAQREIHALFGVIEAAGGRGIPAVKAALELLGRGRRTMRLESLTLRQEEVDRVGKALAALGLRP